MSRVVIGIGWWGTLGAKDGEDGVLHAFQCLLSEDQQPIGRVGHQASCGWTSPGGVMRSPFVGEETPLDIRCGDCERKLQVCLTCAGDGNVEVCVNGHSGCACPCRSVSTPCPDCRSDF